MSFATPTLAGRQGLMRHAFNPTTNERKTAMPTLHATPYDITYPGFYFDTAEEFSERMKESPLRGG